MSGQQSHAQQVAPSRMPYGLLWYFLRPYRLSLLAIMLVMCAALALESLSLAAFFPVFQMMLDPARHGTSRMLDLLRSLARIFPIADPVLAAIALLVVLIVAKATFVLWREVLIAYASGRVLRDAESRTLTRYAAVPYAALIEQKQGDIVFDCLMAPQGVALLVRKAPQLVAEVLKLLAIAVVLLAVSPGMTLALAAVATTAIWCLHHWAKSVAYSSGKGRTEAQAEQMSLVNEFLTGRRQISVYGTTAHWLSRFNTLTDRFTRLLSRYIVWLVIPRTVIEPVVLLILLGFIGAIRLWYPEQFTASLTMFAFVGVALLQALPSLLALWRLRMEVDEVLPDAERVHRVLTEQLVPRAGGQRPFQGLREGVVFDRVSFAFPGRPPLLCEATLTMRRGAVTALVGPSGVGKTTIVNLLVGLLEPTEGRILIDGGELLDYDLTTWRSRIGFVSQDPFVVHATVEENIRLGRRGYSDAQVREAARIAHAHEFISRLPDQYQAIVGERGAKLSSGERQRIAIARAVLGNPELLILDEATSALDQASERIVREAIMEACRGRTVLMVTHGTAMAEAADEIVVLEGGRVSQGCAGNPGQQAGATASLLTQSYGPP